MRIVSCDRNNLSMALHSGMNNVMTTGMSNFNGRLEDVLPNNPLRDYVINLNKYYQSDEYLQQAQAMMKYRSYRDLDILIYLINRDGMEIGATMQYYIMGNPEIGRYYDQGLIKGFINGYQPDYNLDYTDRESYSLVRNGLITDDNDDSFIYYTDDYEPLIEEQVDIINTWEYMKNKIKRGIDPAD